MLESSLNLLKKISEFGYEAYLVGGYPRDLKIGKKTKDIDICTDATPMELLKIFPDAETIHSEYGTVVLNYEKNRYEITTYRKEKGHIGNRKPLKIEYISNLKDDLMRRDFTINTLCIDKNGQRVDLLGASKDIDDKIIKMVGDPKIRLKEDALRILRAIRFATVLDFEIDSNLKLYIKKYGYLLKKLSYDKKREELDRIFTNSNKEKGIKLLCELKLIDALEIPKLKNIKVTPSSIVTWALLDVSNKYHFTNSEKQFIEKIKLLKDENILNRKILYEHGLYVCSLVSELQDIDKAEITKLYNELPIHSKLDIELEPMEICEILNKQPGPFLKEITNDLEERILSGILENDKEEIKDYILNNYCGAN